MIKVLFLIAMFIVGAQWYTISHEKTLLNRYKACLQEVRKIDGCTNWIYSEGVNHE